MRKYTGICRCSAGFTLIELIVVLAIVVVLISAATVAFHDWQIKYNVEAQVKQMVTDFSELRVQAMTRKQRHSITINQKSYVFKSYSSDDEPLAAGTVLPPAIRTVNYALKQSSSTYFDGTQIFEIDQRGLLVSLPDTIFVDSTSSATIDCLTIHYARINPGKKDASWSNCNDQ